MTAEWSQRKLVRRRALLDDQRAAQMEQTVRPLTLATLYPAALIGCLLGGFFLRLLLLDQFPLREDEAIYGYWARHGRTVDWLFLDVWPDKPPLFIALLALAFEGWGATPASARFLSIAASLLTIPVVAATARRWWGPLAGIVAALALTVSPFAISFAPTVYTDSWLVLAGSLALCTAAYGWPFWAGLGLGAAIMTKQQGLFYLPLVIAVLLIERTQSRKAAMGAAGYSASLGFFASLRALLLVLGGLLLIVGPFLWWDSLRWAVAPSPWDLGARNVGGLVWLPPAQWLERTWAWLAQIWYLQASWLAWGLVALALTGGVVGSVAAHRSGVHGMRPAWPAWLLLGSALAFVTLHVTTSVQAWDRYLLPLAPVLALLAGWGVATLSARWRPLRDRWLWVACVGGLLILVPPAIDAGAGRLPIGGDHGAYAGLEEALAQVAARAPISSGAFTESGVVLYHRELGWQAQFYLYDDLAAGQVDLRWIPSATALADNAAKTPHRRRYLVEPEWAPVRDLALHLAARRLQMTATVRSGRFTVYTIREQPPIGSADWRICRPSTPWPVMRASAAMSEGREAQ